MTKVVHYPWVFFISILMVLMLFSYPIYHIKFGLSDYKILPKTLQSREVFDIMKKDFNENVLSPIVMMVKAPGNKFLTEKNIGYLYQLTEKIKDDPRVDDIDSIVSTEPQLTKSQYQALYTGPKEHLNDSLKKLLTFTTNDNFTVVTIVSKYPNSSEKTKQLVKKIRHLKPGDALKITVTGPTANNIDVFNRIKQVFPYALLWIIVLTYLILLILLRSILLPLKAIIMNMISLAASYGALVYIVQEGYLSRILHIEAQGMIDISLLIIIFCALFGFSMDYEVFLLTRIKEFYEQTNDSNTSVCFGIAHTGKIITSAAIIVILICFSFLSADILMIKAFGLGIAIAIFVDAFLIRTMLVPATMTLLRKWIWYLPAWLDRILPSISFNPEEKHF